MKKSFLNKAIISFIILISVFCISYNVFAYTPQSLYDEVWKLIYSKYVDQDNNGQNWNKWRHKYDDEIKTDKDAFVAIDTMVLSLNDPYTKFLNPEEFAEEGSAISGTLKGIGVQISVKDGKLLVVAPIEDTPASKAGLLANDYIVEINGKSTKGMSVKDAADNIRGEEGTTVTLLIRRNNVDKTFIIPRAEIKLKSISTTPVNKMKLNDSIGYIRISTFMNKSTAAEFAQALTTLSKKQGYIIDLRSNPGGLLSNAIFITDMLVSGGTIVSTVDRDGYKDTTRASKRIVTNKPLVVLINGGSASASEILSGALKDNGRATLVGEKTFGKGLVQEINRLPGGSGINITTQKYLTPNGTDINKKGITPDIEIKLTEDDIKNEKDPQLLKAQSVLIEKICQCNKTANQN
ncbi:MAG: S41 family peptidase [Candidatus Gastranaerophilales bacterium]|nr:S41 family peptidase [Candidatus Gastranaerophilales bacterium]